MRKIKFRLRDRFNKIVGYEKWYEGHWHPDNPDEGFSVDSGYWEATPCWLYSVDGERWTPTFMPHRYKDSFTGLKDKNGKEIYEGDIVLTDEAGWKAQVVYRHDCFMCIGLDGKGFSYECNWDEFKVIGSIYENPELLGGK